MAASNAEKYTVDAIVKLAMEKWPDVPDVHGWLRLTARGEWWLDGGRVINEALRDFIGRNYDVDEAGHWYFQNGPQRVYVELETTPWIWRLDGRGALIAHTGARPQMLQSAWLVDQEHFLFLTELGCGLLEDRDAGSVVERLRDAQGTALDEASIEAWLAGSGSAWLDPADLGLEGSLCALGRCASAELESRFGFVREPLAD